MGTDAECQDVATFQRKFGIIVSEKPTHVTRRKLGERLEFHLEEAVKEFQKAIAAQDMAALADSLVDAVYVIKGTAVMLGLAEAWTDLWNDVHRANMEKVPGATHRGHAVDVTKPPGWKGPETLRILYAHGYRRERFCRMVIDETLCVDDHMPAPAVEPEKENAS